MPELGVNVLVSVERVSGAQITTKAIAENGMACILEFSQMGYLQVVRSNDETGTFSMGVVC